MTIIDQINQIIAEYHADVATGCPPEDAIKSFDIKIDQLMKNAESNKKEPRKILILFSEIEDGFGAEVFAEFDIEPIALIMNHPEGDIDLDGSCYDQICCDFFPDSEKYDIVEKQIIKSRFEQLKSELKSTDEAFDKIHQRKQKLLKEIDEIKNHLNN